MSKFRVGDRVEVKALNCCPETRKMYKGKKYKISYETTSCHKGVKCWHLEDAICFLEADLVKLGGSMSKYEDLRKRITALEDGWNKDADDIIMEIRIHHEILFSQDEGRSLGGLYGHITITPKRSEGIRNGIVKTFKFTSQCEKLSAFKDALMWLLDNSSIKKVDRERVDKIADLQRQLDELKGGI